MHIVCLVDQWLDRLDEAQKEILARRFGLCGYEKSTLEEISQATKINSHAKYRNPYLIYVNRKAVLLNNGEKTRELYA